MKKFLSYSVAASVLAGAAGAHAISIPVTAVAVVVNDSVITLGEIDAAIIGPAQVMQSTYRSDPARYEQEVSKLRDDVIEQKVEEKLILHEFITSGYVTNVLEAFVDDRINEEIQRRWYGDRARMIRTLHEEGKTYETFRREEREKFIIEYMNYQNSSNPHKIIISPLKIENYYNTHADEFKVADQVKLRMIELPEAADATPGSAKKLAEEILAKIDSGVPFDEMASVNSAGSHRSEGGDRGWVSRTDFRAEISDAAFKLKPGQHSGVIELPSACYILKVEDVKTAHVKELTEVRGDIERTLRNDETLRLRKLWIQRLKRKSFVMTY